MAGFVRRQEKKTRLATKGLPVSSLSQMGLSSNEYSLVREVSNNSEENEIVGVPISALPVADTPDVTDVVPGVQSGTTKKFSLYSLFGWISGQITAASIGAVPNTRTVNGKALSSDITLSASDVSAVPTSEKGANGGVATLGNDGKVPSAQLPAIASTAADVNYDNTASGLSADDVQEALDELAVGGSASGKADQTTIAPVEDTTTATVAHPLGSIFYLNGILYRALSDIAIGGTINTASGGNATQTTVAHNFKRTVTLTSAQYSQLSAAEKAADIVYIITDDNAISADDVEYDNTTSGLTATDVLDAVDELVDGKAAKADLSSIQATGTTNTTGAAIPAGTHFYLNGVLCRAIAQIDSNAQFTLGTNYVTTNIDTALRRLTQYDELYNFTETTSKTRNLNYNASNYALLVMQVFDSDGNQIVAITQPTLAYRNINVKAYGSSSSQWGSFQLSSDYTQGTFNRTSANTSRVRVMGYGKII